MNSGVAWRRYSTVTRARWAGGINTVVLEVYRRYNCKYLLICKEDELDGTFWKFTQQLLRATQTRDAIGLSQLLSMAFVDAFQT